MQLAAFLAIVPGIVIGYGTGRYLWASRHLLLSLWPIVALLAITSAILSRLFGALDQLAFWNAVVFPLIIGWGVGLSITPARLPRRGAWWEIWKT